LDIFSKKTPEIYIYNIYTIYAAKYEMHIANTPHHHFLLPKTHFRTINE